MINSESPWGILNGIRPAKIATKLLKDGKTSEEVIKYFMEECGTSRDKATLTLQTALCEMPIRDSIYPDGVSIYIGIPFCPSRCLYCSFVTCGTTQAAKLIPEYLECLEKEIIYVGDLVRHNKNRVETVYIGGGTPTTLEHTQLDRLLKQIYENFDMTHCKEFTVEAGRPDTVTEAKLKVLKKHKIDRISINPQTMNLQTLHLIGRAHTPDQIREAMHLSRECGFDNINMDVIAGLPGETPDMFRYTLEEVEKLSPENTTVHTMSIKRSSRLHEYIHEYQLAKPEEVEEMVDYARDFMSRNQKHPYYLYRQKNQLGNLENVGYSKIGFDNLYNIYIMEEIQTIISLGCGGVTKTVDPITDRIERIFNVKEPQDYIARIDEMLERKKILYK